MKDSITFRHTGDLGDIVYAIPAILSIAKSKSLDPVLFLCAGSGTREPMTQARADFIAPLLEHCGIECKFSTEKADIDFSDFRATYRPDRTLAETQAAFVGATIDPSERWIPEITDVESQDYLLICRSARYRNPHGEAAIRSAIASAAGVKFLGTTSEYADHRMNFAPCEHKRASDALEIVAAIQAASSFYGNQSLPFAIAEGMKKTGRILEVSPLQPDCLFDGQIRIDGSATGKETLATDAVMPVLQFWNGDAAQALLLVEILSSIQAKKKQKDEEFCLAFRHDTDASKVEMIASVIRPHFKNLIQVRSERDGTGWPGGCNDLWQSTMMQLSQMSKRGAIKARAVFTFEPDGVPLRHDWLEVTNAEWRETEALGKECFGTVHDAGHENNQHINGNAVFGIRITSQHRELQLSSGPWDIYHRKLLLSIGRDSHAIIQRYGQKAHVNSAEIASIRKSGKVPAWLHGFKNDCAREYVTQAIESGEFFGA